MSLYQTIESICRTASQRNATQILTGRIESTDPEVTIRVHNQLLLQQASLLIPQKIWKQIAEETLLSGMQVILIQAGGVYLVLERWDG